MSNFAIMRSAKLSSMGSVASAMSHCYRDRETPNADPGRTNQNGHLVAPTLDQAMGRLRELLPEKRRKDAVLAVEYVMTASPEWWATASHSDQAAFFQRSVAWLEKKYGRRNVVAATIHRDEKTPHLSAFVAPITKDGRLTAKEFIGGKTTMTADQTSFAEAVADLGLRRGLEGSKATHQTVRKFYAQIQGPAPAPASIDAADLAPVVTKTGFLSKATETPAEIAARISAKVAQDCASLVDAARGTQAALREAARARQKAAQERKGREAEAEARKALEADTAALRAAMKGLNKENREQLVQLLTTTSDQMRQKQAQELETITDRYAAAAKAKREREIAALVETLAAKTPAERRAERFAVAAIREDPRSSHAELKLADMTEEALNKLDPQINRNALARSRNRRDKEIER